jgi:hypothetical protein
VITRPYPQVVSGTPAGWSFDPDSRKFSFSYTTARASDPAKAFAPGSVTEVALPPRAYPKGYAADVRGGAIVSKTGARVLRVAACRAAKRVTVNVVAGGGASQSSCAKPSAKRVRLRVSLKPHRVRAGRRVKVLVRVRAGKSPVRGAVVRLGGARAVTGARGRATLRVRFAHRGRRHAVARARGYLPGHATLRVLRRR